MSARVRQLSSILAVLALAFGVVVVGRAGARAAEAPVDLGTAASFAVLAGSTVTNIGPSVVGGDLGVSPGTAITGFPPGIVNGTIHATDAVAAQAQADLTIAYNSAAGRACNVVLTDQDLGGLTLTSGVYCFSTSAQLTGTLTLDAQGDPNAVFIFQVGSTLITASGSNVALINGAQACNVFWQVGSSATLGTDSHFVGTILALTSITANTGADVDGRLLARNGAVTLDDNTVTVPTVCDTTTTTAGPTTTTPGPTTTISGPTTTTPGPTTTGPTTTTTTAPAGGGGTTSTTLGGGTTSTSQSTTTTTGAAVLLGGGTPSGGGSSTGTTTSLARTGSNLTAMALVGLLAVAIGAAIVLAQVLTISPAGPFERRRGTAAPSGDRLG
jgi:hypothetical protein